MKKTALHIFFSIVIGISGGFLLFDPESARSLWVGGLFVSIGLYAIIFPHVLYSGDLRSDWVTTAASLSEVLFSQWLKPFAWLLLPLSLLTTLGFLADVKLSQLAVGAGLLIIWYTIAIIYSLFSGKWSQEYKTGIKGQRIRETARETGSLSVSVGSLPTMGQTLFVAIFGSLSIILTASAGWFALIIILISILIPIYVLIKNKGDLYGRSLQSEAFFAEYFQPVDEDQLHQRTISKLYWIPGPVRPLANTYLILSDRSGSIHRWFWPLFLISVALTLYSDLNSEWLALSLLILPVLELFFIHRATHAAISSVFWINSRIYQFLAPVFVGLRWTPWLIFTWWLMGSPLTYAFLISLNLLSLLGWTLISFSIHQFQISRLRHA